MKKKNKIIFVLCMLPVLLVSMLVPCFAYTIEIDGSEYEVSDTIFERNAVVPLGSSNTNNARLQYQGYGMQHISSINKNLMLVEYSDSSLVTTAPIDYVLSLETMGYYNEVCGDIEYGRQDFDIPWVDTVSFDYEDPFSKYETCTLEYLKNYFQNTRIYAIGSNLFTELIRFVPQVNGIGVGIFDTYYKGYDYSGIADSWSDYIPYSASNLKIQLSIETDKILGIARYIISYYWIALITPEGEVYDNRYSHIFEIPLSELKNADENVYEEKTISIRMQTSKGTTIPEGFLMIAKEVTFKHQVYERFFEKDKLYIDGLLKDFYEKGKVDGNAPLMNELSELKKDYNVLVNSKGNSEAIPKLFDGIFNSVKNTFNEVLQYEAFGMSVGGLLGIFIGIAVVIIGGKLILSLLG